MQLDLTAILTAIYTGFPCPPPPFQFSCLRACFDEILTVCKQNVSCASVHLVLGCIINAPMSFLCTQCFSPLKILYLTARTSEQFLLHYYYYSWKTFAMKLKLNNYTTPYHAFQHPVTLNSVCAVSFEIGKSGVCTYQILQSVLIHSFELALSNRSCYVCIYLCMYVHVADIMWFPWVLLCIFRHYWWGSLGAPKSMLVPLTPSLPQQL